MPRHVKKKSKSKKDKGTKVGEVMANGLPRPKGFGGSQARAGVTPIALKLRAHDRILQIIGGNAEFDLLIKKIYSQAIRGSFKHQELILNYVLGKPTEKLKIEAADGAGISQGQPIINIIASTKRIEKLNKDVADAEVIEESRIEEMEEVLETAIKHTNGKTIAGH